MALNTSATDRAFIVGLGVDTEAVNGNIQSYFYKTLVTETQPPSMATTSNSAKISASLLQQGYLPGLNDKFTDNADFYTRFKSIQNQSLQTGIEIRIGNRVLCPYGNERGCNRNHVRADLR